ncbi:hypothetical protein ACN6MY_11420 [Peribacillus sp. B-H-3]|uniref:hypothetical protein n=1 Tax=Peribacillus sp. B-H-3 TaxID=3400420 RepID=UPI003B027481
MEFQKITYKEQKSFPAFKNHLEAREYFQQYYMDHFTYKNKKEKDGKEIFSYVLVLNEEAYRSGQEKLARFEIVHGTDFPSSFQTIEINEDGEIYIE